LRKDATNPHYRSKYASLDTIVEQVGPILAKHELVWSTLPVNDEQGRPALRYRLAHAPTGEVLEGTMPLLLSKPDAQGMGSAITYARRYSLCAVLNLVADDDDDGHAASQGRQGSQARSPAQANGKPAAATETAPAPGAEPLTPELYRSLVDAFVGMEASNKAELLQAKLDEFGAESHENVAERVAKLSADDGRRLLVWMNGTPEEAKAA
jgi:hypothetical protein